MKQSLNQALTKENENVERVFMFPYQGDLGRLNLHSKRSIFLSFFIFSQLFVVAQTLQLPSVIPPSPQAQEFIKYIDFPADLSSGLPTIDIPIYNIHSKELNLPISISYHASGLKPNTDESGIIGLGWHLNAGGIITRNINRKPDECVYNQLIPLASDFSGNVGTWSDNPLDQIVKEFKETAPDIFCYSTPGQSGKFVLKRSANLSEFLNPVLMPYKPLIITPNLTTQNNFNSFNYFELKDESGTLFRFGKSILTGNDETEGYCEMDNSFHCGISSWLLTEIISADKSDTISFVYDDVMVSSSSNAIPKVHRIFNYTGFTCNNIGSYDHPNDHPFYSYSAYYYTQKKLTKIKFKTGEVRFTYKSNLYPDQLLDHIDVYAMNNTSTPVQTIKLSQSKYHNISGELNWNKLDELGYYNSTNTKISSYNFSYNTSCDFPAISNNQFCNETYSVDFWGYYNGAMNASGTLPAFTWDLSASGNSIFGSADRNPNATYAAAGILNKIVYPTGGIDSLKYEGNCDTFGSHCGGLRIKSRVHKTGNQSIKRTYSYAGIMTNVQPDYFVSTSASYYFTDGMEAAGNDVFSVFSTASSEPKFDLNINGSPILYTKAIEKFGDDNANTGRIEHYFDDSFIYTDIIWSTYNPNKYCPFGGIYGTFYATVPGYYRNSSFGNVFENRTDCFDNQGNITKQTFNYYSHNLNQRLLGFNASQILSSNCQLISYDFPYNDFYDFYNYRIDQLKQRLDSSVVKDMVSGSVISTKTQYVYNDKNQISTQTTTNSNGSLIKQTFTYPWEESGINCFAMKNNNIIAPVINEKKFVGTSNQLVQTQNTDYNQYGKPLTVRTALYNNALEDRTYYCYNTCQNLQSTNKVGDLPTIYLWSYNYQYPVAKIEGLTYDEVNSAVGSSVISNLAQNALPTSDAIEAIRTNINSSGKTALVSTYTYKPLVGITSMTDPRGVTTVYNYDSFNRLMNMKNQDGNLLKTYKYHYKQ